MNGSALARLASWFRGRSPHTSTTRRTAPALRVEALEPRLTPSWGAVPPAAVVLPHTGAYNLTDATLDGVNHAAGDGYDYVSSRGEVQWIRFRALTTHTFNLAASSSDFDAVLGLYAANGHRLSYSDNATSGGTDPATSFTLVAGATYYLGVTNHPGASGGTFGWTIDGGIEADDVYESNDVPARASNLGVLADAKTLTGLKLLDSADWFLFRTVGRGLPGESVSINFANANGNLDLYLYSALGGLVRSSAGTSDGESVSLAGLPAGAYRVKVVGASGATNNAYSLTITPPPRDDTFENNDTRLLASDLGTISGTGTINSLHLLDAADWYKFTTAAPGTASNSVSINFPTASGNLDLEVYDSAGNRVDSSATTGNAETVSLNGLATGTYYIRVFGALNPYYSLTVASPPAQSDWYQQHLRDGWLVALARADGSDGTLSRAELLGIYAQVERDGTVSADEFADLQTLANATQFTIDPAYRYLAQQVVGHNDANATYGNLTGLPDLAAGSSATRLQQLVGEWFLGLDHPTAAAGRVYRRAAGSLFGPNGPLYTDVKQGGLGDCYLFAALGAAAKQTPADIRGMFTDNGDGTYTVRFYERQDVARYVTVDRYLPTNSFGSFVYGNVGGFVGNAANVLWAALAEKAYVQSNDEGWVPGSGYHSHTYAAIAGGFPGFVSSVITNRPYDFDSFSYYPSASALFSDMVAKFDAKMDVCVNTKPIGYTASYIVPDHSYIMLGYDSINQTVTLANPWGPGGGLFGGSFRPGKVTLTMDQLTNSFSDWCWA